ncbi:MAG: hypothetical protein AVDCRST_MAG12-1523 [uncultured Rubrobacteraceae bacterium]|uniref:DUF3891 family protein n=1 Tax=uncultured Rubrobacteraceae bacterium TaxID=349277 RepID=A0A6J4RTS7_9ACTN|nr:MAG: hypothetical protein AVDCRST_MAG12-1523 [uncultured Rubrobacteraceae bacterium]
MIVRERADSFVLVEQHEHALVSGEFGRRWVEGPVPLGSTLYAVDNHDVAWREPDREVLWNEASGRPYSFLDYPLGAKLAAQRRGIERVEAGDAYAGCLCSMHYARFLVGSEDPEGVAFLKRETARQGRLREGMSDEESNNLERNFRFLRLCDGLSLYLFLYGPGEPGYPPPTPDGFEFDGTRFDLVWEDREHVRLQPFALEGPFEVSVPYREVGKDRRPLGEGRIRLRVSE